MLASGFRRVVALLLLAMIATTAVTNAECAVAPAHTAEVEEVREVSGASGEHAHQHDHDGVPAPVDDDAGTHDRTHENDGCGLLMACGLGSPAAHASDVAFQTEQFQTRSASVRDAYDSPTLAFEPPPPRIS